MALQSAAAALTAAQSHGLGRTMVAGAFSGGFVAAALSACAVRYWVQLAPLRELEAAGAVFHRVSGDVRLDPPWRDADLSRLVELLNQLDDVPYWYSIDLSRTRASGEGLGALTSINRLAEAEN